MEEVEKKKKKKKEYDRRGEYEKRRVNEGKIKQNKKRVMKFFVCLIFNSIRKKENKEEKNKKKENVEERKC